MASTGDLFKLTSLPSDKAPTHLQVEVHEATVSHGVSSRKSRRLLLMAFALAGLTLVGVSAWVGFTPALERADSATGSSNPARSVAARAIMPTMPTVRPDSLPITKAKYSIRGNPSSAFVHGNPSRGYIRQGAPGHQGSKMGSVQRLRSVSMSGAVMDRPATRKIAPPSPPPPAPPASPRLPKTGGGDDGKAIGHLRRLSEGETTDILKEWSGRALAYRALYRMGDKDIEEVWEAFCKELEILRSFAERRSAWPWKKVYYALYSSDRTVVQAIAGGEEQSTLWEHKVAVRHVSVNPGTLQPDEEDCLFIESETEKAMLWQSTIRMGLRLLSKDQNLQLELPDLPEVLASPPKPAGETLSPLSKDAPLRVYVDLGKEDEESFRELYIKPLPDTSSGKAGSMS